MSEQAGEPSASGPTEDAVARPDATVLPFPSNRPLDPPVGAARPPRLRGVIGEVLREERLRQERTLAEVAADAAVSLPYLSEVERGRKEVSSDLLDAIGTALDVPLVEILERSVERIRTEMTSSTRSGQFRMECSTRFQLAA
jgi:hypothetical protein